MVNRLLYKQSKENTPTLDHFFRYQLFTEWDIDLNRLFLDFALYKCKPLEKKIDSSSYFSLFCSDGFKISEDEE